MDLHPSCDIVAFLLGTWRGKGDGHYPTIDSFEYLEEVTFGHVGKPFLTYTQKTRNAKTDEPLHAEAGYLRVVGDAQVELVLVQPSGIVEMHHGTVDGSTITFVLDSVQVTSTAKSVTDVSRTLEVTSQPDGTAVLTYDLEMAAVGEPMTHHLHAELARVPQD